MNITPEFLQCIDALIGVCTII